MKKQTLPNIARLCTKREMVTPKPCKSALSFFSILLLFYPPPLSALPVLPQPAFITPVQPFFPTSSPATIPAFPEQSDIAGCPLDLSEELFQGINSACGEKNKQVSRSRCCPVLAAWLYAAYAGTALGRTVRKPVSYDLPVLPDDSQTCVDNLQKSLRAKGVELQQPNGTCDVVYCYCGIRLHRLSSPQACPGAFSVSGNGKLVALDSVLELEKNCKGSSYAACSKCLQSLYQLNGKKGENASESDRKNKLDNRDCELMGLTWLLAKNKTAYIPTVSAILRAFMMNSDDLDPQSCSVSHDGMPLAVDSAMLDDQSSSNINRFAFSLKPFSFNLLIFLFLLCVLHYYL